MQSFMHASAELHVGEVKITVPMLNPLEINKKSGLA